MIYGQLFISFLQVGLFSIGGGYAAMPIIQSQVVQRYGWLTMKEFTDLITIAEMTPGPIAINSATFVGIRLAGPVGAVIATLGCILPSLILVSLLSCLYSRYRASRGMQRVLGCLRPTVVALIASAALTILSTVLWKNGSGIQWLGALLFILALAALRVKKWNPILVMTGCGILNLAITGIGGI